MLHTSNVTFKDHKSKKRFGTLNIEFDILITASKPQVWYYNFARTNEVLPMYNVWKTSGLVKS